MRGPLQGQVAGEDLCRSLIAQTLPSLQRMPPEDLRLNFQRSVLMKLDSILEKKQEGLVPLQRVVFPLAAVWRTLTMCFLDLADHRRNGKYVHPSG
ncbi:hypothetical protein HHUSO_G36810 [Huso huso]|uniref:Uncharacterized protein n=1 Tax=Huso huso TaxID=61971 RepID=A0ABR0Y0V0_HUSHU